MDNNEMMIKMSHIGVINLLELKIGIEASPFEYLEKMTVEDLEKLRDELIPKYNGIVEARKFAGEMIYDRKLQKEITEEDEDDLPDFNEDKGELHFVNKDDWIEKFWPNNYHVWLTAQCIEFCVNAEHESAAMDFIMDFCVEKEWEGLYSKETILNEEYMIAGNFGYQFTTHNIRIELMD